MRKIIMIAFAILQSWAILAQQNTITGKVIHKINGEPLSGVSVQSKNKTVTTDANGKFSIEAAAGETITLSYVGMQPVSIKVNNASKNLNLEMEESINDLNTVVVTGYKTEKKVDLTGAVSVVNVNT